MSDEKDIIRLCKANDKYAQEKIFNKYSPVLLSICRRYINDRSKAEDVMQDAFIIIFTKIKQFKEIGSFEGWIKRITLNAALMQLRKNKKEVVYEGLDVADNQELENDLEAEVNLKDKKSLIKNANFSQDDILEVIKELPDGFRTVFNLYVIEGFKHKEIAKQLNISIGTSKSQLLRARKKIESLLYNKAVQKINKK